MSLSKTTLVFFLAVATAYGDTATLGWAKHYPGTPVFSFDEASEVVADSSGNFIVAGYTDEGTRGRDMLIIKYSSAGVPLWTNIYNGPASGDDMVTGLAVDVGGNAIVAGYSEGNQTYSDYTIIKYSSAGVSLWTNRYDGPGQWDDIATDLAVDANGNVFVTGYSHGGIETWWDYATIKYSGAGVPLWTNRYDGPGKDTDSPADIVIDTSGSAIVTGSSVGSGSSSDYATIKYSNTGTVLWVNRFTGPGSREDAALALAVDANNNVFVTGNSNDGSGSYKDFATIKYTSAGSAVWTNRYNGIGNYSDVPRALAVDAGGNVIVAGSSSGDGMDSDYATLKYSNSGLPLWTNRFSGPGDFPDEVSAITVDSSGNVFVTGASAADFATIKYAGGGTPLWTNRYDGPLAGYDDYDAPHALAVDASGNVTVVGASVGYEGSSDFTAFKYSSGGATLWSNSYNHTRVEFGEAIAVGTDGDGNAFVTGYSVGATPSFDYTTIGYSSLGAALWTNHFDGLGRGEDKAAAIAVDTAGSVFVTGYSDRTGYADFDYATIKYSNAGLPLWTNHYSGPGNYDDKPVAIALDNNGNAIVAGYSFGNQFDYTTIKYSSAGVPLWTNRYNGPANGEDKVASLAVDSVGNVIVTGVSLGNGTSADYATIKYSSAGIPLWTNRYNGAANDVDDARGVSVDAAGNVFVTGCSRNNNFNAPYNGDFATVAYSASGTPLWTNCYNGPGNAGDLATAIAVDGNGNVFVAGVSASSLSYPFDYDYAVLKYSSAGLPLWTNRYNGAGNYDETLSALVADINGDVYVTGTSVGSGNFDFGTLKYSGAGAPLWTNRYNGPWGFGDRANAMALDPAGNIFVAGYSEDNQSYSPYHGFATVKYVPSCPTISISPAILPNGVIGSAFSETLTAAHGAGLCTFSLSSGYLPPGLLLSSNGILSGKPFTLGTYNFTVRATDMNGCVGHRAYSIAVHGSGPSDSTRPTVRIISPAPNIRTNRWTINVNGTAADNVEVAAVAYRLNDGPFQLATGRTAWTASLPLVPGTNSFSVKAVDRAGNESLVSTRSFFLVVTSALTLNISGTGSVTPTISPFGTPTNGALLEIGKPYTVTAVPGLNWLFTNWISGGNVLTNSLKLTFLMRSNLVLNANFITNRFVAAAGVYNGLFWDKTNGVDYRSAGFFNLTVSSRQTFSGKLKLEGASLSFSGTLNQGGDTITTKPILRAGKSSLSVRIHVDLEGNDFVTGTVSSMDGDWASSMEGDRAIFNAATNPASAYMGGFTMVVPRLADPTMPSGDGFASVTIDSGGRIVMTGALADGAPFTQTVPVSKHGHWPLYVSAYSGKGSIMGWVTVQGAQTPALSGSLYWVKTSVPGDIFYPGGFTNTVDLVASRYAIPAYGDRVIDLTYGNGNAILTMGNLPVALTNKVSLSLLNSFAVGSTNNQLKLSLVAKTGLLKGTFRHPANSAVLTPLSGVVLQEQNIGRGFFKGTNQSGCFLLQGN